MPAASPVPPLPERADPLAFLPRQDRHQPKCGPVAPSRVSRKRAYVLIGIHVLIGLHIWHWLATGSSLTPMEPSEAMQTVELGRINAGFLLFLILIASTLVFGRFFCGWACHVVALQDLSAFLLGKVGLKPRPLRSRLLVLAPWVVAFHMFAWPIVQHWFGMRPAPLPAVGSWEWHLTTQQLWQTFPGPIMAVGTFMVVGFLIVWWLGAKGFCTHGCPYGAFFALADRVAPVRIKVTAACDACGHCTNVCTSNVRVHEEVAKHGQIVDPGCMKCLDCVSVCPKDALYIGLALPKPFATSQQRIRARADFTWPEEILLAVVALATAQWVFRGAWFGEGVPLLMAVGLGVITAVLALLFVRLLRRPEVTFQHATLKRGGRLTKGGRWAALAVLGWLLFTGYTGYVEWRREQARLLALEPVRQSLYQQSVSPVALGDALAAVDRYRGLALCTDPKLVEMRGLLLRGLGRHAEAEQQLLACLGNQRALVLDEASLALANYMLDPQRRRFAEARGLVEHVLASQPQHPIALVLQQRLANVPK
jgi:polyferredoxin